MNDLFGVPISVGTISESETLTTEVLAKPVQEARDLVEKQAVAHLDETSWRQDGQRAWLWVAVTSVVTVFAIRLSRGGQVARELLGETFGGILVTDRYSGYNWYPVRWRQFCWSHVLRDFEAMRGRGGVSEEIGAALLEQAHQMFTWWHRVREGTLKRSTFRSYMTSVRREVERLLEAGSQCGVANTEGTCREMLKRRQALWTFVQVEGDGAHQQLVGAGHPSGCATAQNELWHAERGGFSLCRKHDDGRGNAEATQAQHSGIPHGRS